MTGGTSARNARKCLNSRKLWKKKLRKNKPKVKTKTRKRELIALAPPASFQVRVVSLTPSTQLKNLKLIIPQAR